MNLYDFSVALEPLMGRIHAWTLWKKLLKFDSETDKSGLDEYQLVFRLDDREY